MASQKKSGSFGAPKPLPGQAGFTREKESTLLENETTQMADRLQALRDQMLREKEMRDASATQKVGGTKWKSARSDRSVRNYAKEVKDKYQQKVENARAIPQGRRRGSGGNDNKSVVSSQNSISGSGGGGGNIGNGGGNREGNGGNLATNWTMDEVVSWLESLGLSTTYKDVFIQNEITGPILLDIGLDDLDYMEIRKLAHRKLILKGIQDLKKNGRPTLNLSSQQASSSSSTNASLPPPPGASVGTSSEAGTTQSPQSYGEVKPSPNKIHWSQAKPLSENVVSNDQQFVNLADGVYDEAAQAREFQAAVAAWRSGGGGGVSDGPQQNKKTSSSSTSTESSILNQGLAEFGFGPESESPRNGIGKNEWVNPWATSTNDDTTNNTTNNVTVISHPSTSLADGVYDEAAQAREFQAAVAAWRSGGDIEDTTPGGGGGVGGNRGASRGQPQGVGMNRLRDAEEVAQELGRKLDEARSKEAEQLAKQREAVEKRIREQKAELEERRAKIMETNALRSEKHDDDGDHLEQENGSMDITGEWDSDNDDNGGGYNGYDSHVTDVKDDEVLVDGLSPLLSARSDISCDIIETTLGYTPRREDMEVGGNGESSSSLIDESHENSYVVVEEPDSDDE